MAVLSRTDFIQEQFAWGGGVLAMLGYPGCAIFLGILLPENSKAGYQC